MKKLCDWQRLKPIRRTLPWLLLTASLTACRHGAGNEYFCPPTVSYDQTGAIRPEVYAVDRMCYKSMTAKQKACYAEAR